ncbi:MAG: chemotaxis protein CheB, partial [Phototrophicaceae bacterium]
MSDENGKQGKNTDKNDQFPIVGIGASAGGLDAFERFFTNMPSDNNMAFVIVQHLDPTHDSILGELLARYTGMQVFQVKDGVKVQPNCVYVIPPNSNIALFNGVLHLVEPSEPRGFRLPVDYLFRSMAEDQGERAIGIVLSGTGSDGMMGIKAIKGAGGMAMAQDPDTAKYAGMPLSAVSNETIDFVLAPEDMPKQLIAYIKHPVTNIQNMPNSSNKFTTALQKIFILLRTQTGHDFSLYKPNTINRRISRRMAVNQFQDLEDYTEYLQRNPVEIETLFRDLLIGVTNFFRDTEAYEIIENQVIPEIFETTNSDQMIRVWVSACSTGEEAYSLAILFQEYMARTGEKRDIQIFATDIDSRAISQARQGIYPDNIVADVDKKRLDHFFTKFSSEHGGYQISKSIRDMVIFAEQNIIKDPPFSRLDLISCRNLLIYLQPELQKRIIPLFHYALKPGGYLFLGTSETLGEFSNLLQTIDRKLKIFRRSKDDFSHNQSYRLPDLPLHSTIGSTTRKVESRPQDVVEQMLLDEFTPIALLIRGDGEILYTHGRTGKYLELARGTPRTNILQMAREGLRMPLTTAVHKVLSQRKSVEFDRLLVQNNDSRQLIRLLVHPVPDAESDNILLILIEELQNPDKDNIEEKSDSGADRRDKRLMQLDQELQSTREYLQTTIEELEASNEELKSTNEELQSSNEELQSTNEELETAKEELQSINEELMSVNTELTQKIEELSDANNDVNNLLASVGIGVLFLDLDLNVHRYNPMAAQIVNLIETDTGRPLKHLVTNLLNDSLVEDSRSVIETLIP